jgi:hypothetical protein
MGCRSEDGLICSSFEDEGACGGKNAGETCYSYRDSGYRNKGGNYEGGTCIQAEARACEISGAHATLVCEDAIRVDDPNATSFNATSIFDDPSIFIVPSLAFWAFVWWRKRRQRLRQQQSEVVPAPAGQPQEVQPMQALQPMQAFQPMQVAQAQVVQAMPMQGQPMQGQPMMQVVQAQVVAPVASSGGDHAEQLLKLKQLFDAGAITAKDFEQQKARHLAQM